VSRLEQATLLPSFYAEDTPIAANETWARLHSDPLFAIRQQEQSARKQVIANPVQMMRIKQQVSWVPFAGCDAIVPSVVAAFQQCSGWRTDSGPPPVSRETAEV